MAPYNQIGRFRDSIVVSQEYARLAREDEAAANILARAGHYRQAVYFVVQAMEKHLRAKIFSIIDPADEQARQENRNHSIEDAVLFLIETITRDPSLRSMIREQFENYLFRGLRFNLFHNDLRYPTYFERTSAYACLEISDKDLIVMFDRLDWLKEFMKELALLVS